MRIDKRVLKEFLRLKWHETKWIWIGVLPFFITYYFIAIPFLEDLIDKSVGYFDVEDYFMAGVFNVLLLVAISLIGVIIRVFILWLKSNWKQATKNVYPKRKK